MPAVRLLLILPQERKHKSLGLVDIGYHRGPVIDYAYNPTAGDPILTGVPEPDTAGLLLLALLTGKAWRKRSK